MTAPDSDMPHAHDLYPIYHITARFPVHITRISPLERMLGYAKAKHYDTTRNS